MALRFKGRYTKSFTSVHFLYPWTFNCSAFGECLIGCESDIRRALKISLTLKISKDARDSAPLPKAALNSGIGCLSSTCTSAAFKSSNTLQSTQSVHFLFLVFYPFSKESRIHVGKGPIAAATTRVPRERGGQGEWKGFRSAWSSGDLQVHSLWYFGRDLDGNFSFSKSSNSLDRFHLTNSFEALNRDYLLSATYL